MREADPVIEEIVQLRRMGYRFIALADDNFYPVTLTDIQLAERQGNAERVAELKGLRAERFRHLETIGARKTPSTPHASLPAHERSHPEKVDG